MLSVRVHEGDRPGSNRRLRGSQPRMLPSTPRPPRSGDDRTRTGGLSPDKRALCSSELRPPSDGAGGIRTHGLELMRLARTAAPLPRFARREGGLAGRSRTCGFRLPKPAGCQLPYGQMNVRSVPPAGLEPATSGLRARRHRHFDHGGKSSSGGRARTCALAINSRASYRLDHAGMQGGAEGEGVEPPRPESPPVFETGYRAGGSPSRRVAPAGVEPATPRLRDGSSAD
jgi:hypothetical protein